jgi:RNA polymerase sigma-70 factor (family 1)
MRETTEILPDEKELFARIATGDEAAFTQIFHLYNRRIFPFVLRMIKSDFLAEEIVQDVFTKLWTKRSYLAEVNSPQSYIFTMATNRTLDQLKKISNESRLIKELVIAMQNLRNNETEEWLDAKESAHLINDAVDNLPPQRKIIYKLSRNEGKSYKEIAEQLNISPSTVKNQLIEAVRSIKEYLQSTPGASMAVLFFICETYRQ